MTGAGGGFDQFITDPEAEKVAVDVDIAALSGPVLADADLLP